MPNADLTIGYFGKIPATGDFVTWNLSRAFVERWDRWMSTELRARPAEGDLDPRCWRFIVPAGIFCDQACAGVWRMSEDRVGRRYPFVIAGVGSTPEPGDAWFDAIAVACGATVTDFWQPQRLVEKLQALTPPAGAVYAARIVFWCDDWQVHEFAFSDIHDLAANGLPAMRAPRLDAEATVS